MLRIRKIINAKKLHQIYHKKQFTSDRWTDFSTKIKIKIDEKLPQKTEKWDFGIWSYQQILFFFSLSCFPVSLLLKI